VQKFGTGTAAQSEAGKKGGQIAKERGAGIMQNPSEFGKKGGRARGGEQDE